MICRQGETDGKGRLRRGLRRGKQKYRQQGSLGVDVSSQEHEQTARLIGNLNDRMSKCFLISDCHLFAFL